MPVENLTLDDRDIVKAARESYNNLTLEQQELVSNYDVLVQAEAKIADLEADAEADSFRSGHAEALALTVDTVKIGDRGIVNTALEAYEGLSDAVKGKLAEQKALLDNLLSKILDLEAEVQAVIEAINVLPPLEDLTLEEKSEVESARAAYDVLTDEQKSLVTNYSALVEAETKIADLEAEAKANEFKTTHNAALALSVETVQISDKVIVTTALTEYNNLSEAVRGKLSAEKVLLDNLLLKIWELESEVDSVKNMIDALPEVDALTVYNWVDVKEVRTAYNRLTDEQKELVGTSLLQKLESAESRVEALAAPVIDEVIDNKIIPAFMDFIDVINGQAPKSNPPYKLWIDYDLEDIVAIILISKEAQEMDHYLFNEQDKDSLL